MGVLSQGSRGSRKVVSMTNTVAGTIESVVEAFGLGFNAVVGTAVVALGIVIVLGLAAGWFKRRPKAG